MRRTWGALFFFFPRLVKTRGIDGWLGKILSSAYLWNDIGGLNALERPWTLLNARVISKIQGNEWIILPNKCFEYGWDRLLNCTVSHVEYVEWGSKSGGLVTWVKILECNIKKRSQGNLGPEFQLYRDFLWLMGDWEESYKVFVGIATVTSRFLDIGEVQHLLQSSSNNDCHTTFP